MFEDVIEPDLDTLKKRVKELEDEVYELEMEIISNRLRMTKDLETITEAARTINKCKEKFGEDAIDNILQEVEKELKNRPEVTIDGVKEEIT